MNNDRRKLMAMVVFGWLFLTGFLFGKRSTEMKFQAAFDRLQTSEMTDTDCANYDAEIARAY